MHRNGTNESDAGLAYFLPMGRIHIVATQNVFLVTNFGVAVRNYDNGMGGGMLSNSLALAMTTTVTDFTATYDPNYTSKVAPPLLATNVAQLTNYFSTNYVLTASLSTNALRTNSTETISANSFTGSTQSTVSTNPIWQALPSQVSNHSTSVITTITEQPLVTTNFTYTVNVSVDYRADREALFLLKPKMDWFHDDSAGITVDGNGLLASVGATNTDQTGNAVVSLAEAAVQTFVLAGGSLGTSMPTPVRQNVFLEQLNGTVAGYSFDPREIRSPLPLAEELTSNNWQTALRLGTNDHDDLKELEQIIRINGESDADDEIRPALKTVAGKLTADILNRAIGRTNLSLQGLTNSGVAVRPETRAIDKLANSDTNASLTSLRSLANRMLIEDAFTNYVTKYGYPAPTTVKTPVFPHSIDVSFNPFDPVSRANAEVALSYAGITLDTHEFTDPGVTDYYTNWAKPPSGTRSGVFYRPPIPYEIGIRDFASNVVTTTVLLPNRSPIVHLDLKKASFVSAVSQVTLTNGFVTSYSFSKPSAIAMLANYPLTILGNVTTNITNIAQFRVNLANLQTGLQTALASNQAILNSALVAQQNSQIAYTSNMMTLFNAMQAYKILTNAPTGTNAPASH